MILTHLVFFSFLDGASTDITPVVVQTGSAGEGAGRRKKFKSWDQREAERQEQIRKDAEAKAKTLKDKYGDMPKGLEDALKPAPSPYKRLSPTAVKAYANSVQAQDDEEAMSIIMALI